MNSLPQQPAPLGQTDALHRIERPRKTSPLTPRPVRLQSMSWIEKIEHQITLTDLIAVTPHEVKTAAPKKKKWLSTAFRTTVTLVLFVLLAKSVSWPTLIATLISVHHTYLLVGLGLGLLGVGLSAYVWRVLLIGEGIQVDLGRLIDLYLVGVAFNHFLPSSMGGDAVKAYYMGRESGNGVGSASAVLLSRVTGFLGMLLMALPTIFFFEDNFKDTVVVEFLLTSGLVLSGICGTLVVANYLPKISARFLKQSWTKHKLFLTLLKVGTTLSKSARKPRSMAGAILFGSIFWVTTCLNSYMYGEALGLHIPLYFYLIAIPFASTISSLPISINGFGVRESLFLYLFSKVHVPPSSALLLALLMDTQRIVLGVIGGCIYFTMSGAIKKAQEAKSEDGL